MDAPPFFLYAGEYIKPVGLNFVGLRRGGFNREEVASLKKAYRLLYRSGLLLEDALRQIEAEADGPLARELTAFIRSSKRGIARA
jgi:UDP-N-acetylglucosamine acyltransferase